MCILKINQFCMLHYWLTPVSIMTFFTLVVARYKNNKSYDIIIFLNYWWHIMIQHGNKNFICVLFFWTRTFLLTVSLTEPWFFFIIIYWRIVFHSVCYTKCDLLNEIYRTHKTFFLCLILLLFLKEHWLRFNIID